MENNYIKILQHLESFAGDGQFHPVDAFLEQIGILEKKNKVSVLNDLMSAGYIQFKGGYSGGIYFSSAGRRNNSFRGDRSGSFSIPPSHVPFTAKIAPAGSHHLAQIKKPMKNYNLTVGNNSNVVVDSKNVAINDPEMFKGIMKLLAARISADQNATDQEKQEAIRVVDQAIEESGSGKLKPSTVLDIVALGANIVTIAPFITDVVLKMLPQ